MTNMANGYDDYAASAETGSEAAGQREIRGQFVSRRRRLRNRWNVRMVKGERAQQAEHKQGGSGEHR
jgi:hypothetical protein